MRGVALAALVVACGGSSSHPASPPPVSPRPVTRVPVEDTEPEEGVTIVNGHGHMDPATVEAGISPHTQDLTECYTAKVGRRRWLGGHVSLHWDIKADATVTAVKLAESDLGAWPVEKCLLEVAKSATFGKPIGGNAEFSVPLDFSAKGRPTTWDDDQSAKAVGKQLAKLDACSTAKVATETGGKKKVAVPDDVTVTLYVGPHGAVQSVGFSTARSVLDPAWADCAEKAVLTWRLPDPKGQIAKLAIRYRPQ